MKVGPVSLPIAVGLPLMMYPVLADVRYRQLGWITGDRRVVVTSLLLNWTLGPAPMVALADAPAGLAHLRTGLIIVDCTL